MQVLYHSVVLGYIPFDVNLEGASIERGSQQPPSRSGLHEEPGRPGLDYALLSLDLSGDKRVTFSLGLGESLSNVGPTRSYGTKIIQVVVFVPQLLPPAEHHSLR